jgi:ribosomal protein L24
MTRFAVGDQVVIRYGKHEGQTGRIIKTREPNVYEVKVEDGFILFYSEKGLEKDEAH